MFCLVLVICILGLLRFLGFAFVDFAGSVHCNSFRLFFMLMLIALFTDWLCLVGGWCLLGLVSL